jgi:hypothetical protein
VNNNFEKSDLSCENISLVEYNKTLEHYRYHDIVKYYRRKFRSQTSDNMNRWKSRGGKSQRGEEQKREDKRRERERRKKMQARER